MTEMAVQAPLVRPRPGTYAGVFLITLSTLMYEIALTRIFSVTMWYHVTGLVGWPRGRSAPRRTSGRLGSSSG